MNLNDKLSKRRRQFNVLLISYLIFILGSLVIGGALFYYIVKDPQAVSDFFAELISLLTF